MARNESLRLPYFLDYYFKLGVDRIFFIDNDSTDQTADLALAHEHVHVFKIEEGYKYSWYWMEYFLETYGKNSWCVVADVDELIFYPHAELLNLKELINYFNKNGFTAMKSLLLDIYADKPIRDSLYQAGDNPLEICPYFDTNYQLIPCNLLDKKNWKNYTSDIFIGGVRSRAFPYHNQPWTFYLSKIPVFKFLESSYLHEGMHAINGATLADIKGVVFHTKFMHDFIAEAAEEAEREQFCNAAAEPKLYHYHLSKNPDLALKDENSKKFENSAQLVQYGLMTGSASFDQYVNELKAE